MHDHDEELFEGKIEISRTERGASFNLSPESYFRLATCAMNASGMGIEPAVICRLPNDKRGCKLVLFGRTHQFTIRVRVLRSSTTIALTCQPLDGLHCQIPVYEADQDDDCHWSRCVRSMLAVEGTHYVDSHWALEQGEGGAMSKRRKRRRKKTGFTIHNVVPRSTARHPRRCSCSSPAS